MSKSSRDRGSAVSDFTNVQRVDRKTYIVDFAPRFNIGSVPNGGYVAGHFIAAALAHVAEYGHKHAISAHWDFLSRSQEGRGTLVVDEAKIARNMSVLLISLYQEGQLTEAPWVSPDAPRVVMGTITCRDMANELGMSLDSGWKLEYPPQPADLKLLPLGQDPNWEPSKAAAKFRPTRHWKIYEQKTPPTSANIHDMWLEYASGDSIKDLDLTYLADCTPAICTHAVQADPANSSKLSEGATFWYPTLNIHMDIKKTLPLEGVKWLRLRTTIRLARNGRYGCDVDIFDTTGEFVAQYRHVAMIVDMSRNMAARKPAKAANL